MYEMPISCPMPAIHVTDLQITQRQFLPRIIFDDMLTRYKTVLARTFQCGAWKNRSHEEILAGFGCNYSARYDRDRSGVQGTKVFTLEISGYTEGDVIHMNQVLKESKQLQVPCTDREEGEDPAGDMVFVPTLLTFHLTISHAVRATLATLKDNQQESVSMAAGRVNKLWVEVPKLIEVRQVIMPISMTAKERLENITLAFIMVLTERATDISDTMEIADNNTSLHSALWEKARNEARMCIISVIETTAVTVGTDKLCNFVFQLSAAEYVEEILGNDLHINRIMNTSGKRTRIEMRKVDPDNSSDARQIREYEARQNNNKKNNNNDWSKISANGSKKIQGKWTNPVQNVHVRSTGEQSRGAESQGGADIRFTKESAIQKPEYQKLTMLFEGALETRCSALQRQYEGQLTEMKEEMKTPKKDIKDVHFVMEQKNQEDASWKVNMEYRAKDTEANIMREIEENRLEGRRGHDHLATAIAAANTSSQELMQQILTRLNQVPSGYMSQSAQQMLQTSQVSPGYMTQPAQEKADTEMGLPPTLKRPSREQGAPEGKGGGKGGGKGKGAGRGMDTEFKITIIMSGVEMKAEDLFIVTSDLTLAMLKDKLISNMRNMKLPYEFVTSYYSGQQEEREGDQHTMQDMSMQEGSTLRVYFLGPESPIINRPLSAEEKSLTIKFPSNPTGNSASNIGRSGEDIIPTISENLKLVGYSQQGVQKTSGKPDAKQQESNSLGSLHGSPEDSCLGGKYLREMWFCPLLNCLGHTLDGPLGDQTMFQVKKELDERRPLGPLLRQTKKEVNEG